MLVFPTSYKYVALKPPLFAPTPFSLFCFGRLRSKPPFCSKEMIFVLPNIKTLKVSTLKIQKSSGPQALSAHRNMPKPSSLQFWASNTVLIFMWIGDKKAFRNQDSIIRGYWRFIHCGQQHVSYLYLYQVLRGCYLKVVARKVWKHSLRIDLKSGPYKKTYIYIYI